MVLPWTRPCPLWSASGRRQVKFELPVLHVATERQQINEEILNILYTNILKFSLPHFYLLPCTLPHYSLSVSSWWIKERMTLAQTGRQIPPSNIHPWSVTMSRSLVTTLCLSLFLCLSFTCPVTKSFAHIVVLSKLSPSIFFTFFGILRHRIHDRVFICLCFHFISVCSLIPAISEAYVWAALCSLWYMVICTRPDSLYIYFKRIRHDSAPPRACCCGLLNYRG